MRILVSEMEKEFSGLVIEIFEGHLDIASRRQARKGTGHYVRTRLAAVVMQATNFLNSTKYPQSLKTLVHPQLQEIIHHCYELLDEDSEYERISSQKSGRFINRRDQLASEIQQSIDHLHIDHPDFQSKSLSTNRIIKQSPETFPSPVSDEFEKFDEEDLASGFALSLEENVATQPSFSAQEMMAGIEVDPEMSTNDFVEIVNNENMNQIGDGIDVEEFENPDSGVNDLLELHASQYEREETNELSFSLPEYLSSNLIEPTENKGLEEQLSSHWSLFERNIEFALEYRDYIRTIPLLRPEDEVSLARRIEAGLFAEQKLTQLSKLSKTLERELRWVARDGQRAKSQMVGANLRLVFQLASRQPYFGLDLMDVVQEGNIGLLKAVEKFDYKLGHKFSTYATWWIRQAISRATADQGRLIRLPVHVMDSIKKLRNFRRSYLNSNNKLPTYEADAIQMEVSIEKINELDRLFTNPISLDSEIGQTSTRLVDLLVDDSQKTVEDTVAEVFLSKQLESVLDSLSERQAATLRMRYGIGDNMPKTLDAVGEAFGVTRERIRQIEKQTMETLREAEWNVPIKDYLDTEPPLVQPKALSRGHSKNSYQGTIYPVSVTVNQNSAKKKPLQNAGSIYVPTPQTINDFIEKLEEAIENGNWELAENLETTIWEMSQDQTD